jgi:hypothetical protein
MDRYSNCGDGRRRDRDVTHRNSPWSLLPALLLAAVLCLQPARARADTESSPITDTESSPITGALLGAGSGLFTLVYTPLKLAYAGSGLAVGGLVYLWSAGDSYRAGRMTKVIIGGDYVITPDHLKGDRKLRFTGRKRRPEPR